MGRYSTDNYLNWYTLKPIDGGNKRKHDIDKLRREFEKEMTIMDTPGLLDMETEMGTIVLAAEHE